MRRAALLAIAAAIALPSIAGSSAGASSPNRLLVTGVEYSLTLSHAPLAPGRTLVQFHNSGGDPHNLIIQKAAGGPKHRTPDHTAPDGTDTISLRLRKGTTYVFYCSLKHHRAKGMEAYVGVTG